jgi:hypothetical protein
MKQIAAGILVVMFGGLSAAVWGAFLDINSNSIKVSKLEKRIDREDLKLDTRLQRIEEKLDTLIREVR